MKVKVTPQYERILIEVQKALNSGNLHLAYVLRRLLADQILKGEK